MPRILHVNGTDGEPVATVDSLEGVKRVVEGLSPGRYHVDEISGGPLLTGHTSRRWGVGIKRADGSVDPEPDPWEE